MAYSDALVAPAQAIIPRGIATRATTPARCALKSGAGGPESQTETLPRIGEAALAPGRIPGTVAGYVFEGARQLYDVTIPGGMVRVEMITSAVQGRSFQAGDEVKVEVSPETSVLLPSAE